jgi:nickel-dependent lactate racemase
MGERIELPLGSETWVLTTRPGQLVEVRRPAVAAPAAGPRELVRGALEEPFGFEPMRRALTPDDHVTVVVDEQLPHLAELLAGVFEHLGSAGVRPEAVTLLTTPPATTQGWIDDLPDEFADVHVEIHDPKDRKKLAYLATTKAGRRVYLNRTLVEADFVILLTGRRYDPVLGYAGAEAAVFPALGDEEMRAAYHGKFHAEAPGAKPWPVRAEAAEVLWLLGTPFLVQVIEGSGGAVQEVVAGLPDSAAEGVRRQDARWRGAIAARPDTVFAVVPVEAATFADLAWAAMAAARVVEPDGRIVVLTPAAPPLGEGAGLFARTDEPAVALKALAKEQPADWAAAHEWATAAGRGRLLVGGGPLDEIADDLFAVPVAGNAEAQRLADAAKRLLIVPDAHRTVIDMT